MTKDSVFKKVNKRSASQGMGKTKKAATKGKIREMVYPSADEINKLLAEGKVKYVQSTTKDGVTTFRRTTLSINTLLFDPKKERPKEFANPKKLCVFESGAALAHYNLTDGSGTGIYPFKSEKVKNWIESLVSQSTVTVKSEKKRIPEFSDETVELVREQLVRLAEAADNPSHARERKRELTELRKNSGPDEIVKAILENPSLLNGRFLTVVKPKSKDGTVNMKIADDVPDRPKRTILRDGFRNDNNQGKYKERAFIEVVNENLGAGAAEIILNADHAVPKNGFSPTPKNVKSKTYSMVLDRILSAFNVSRHQYVRCLAKLTGSDGEDKKTRKRVQVESESDEEEE